MDSRLKEFTLTKVGMGAGMTMGEGVTIPHLSYLMDTYVFNGYLCTKFPYQRTLTPQIYPISAELGI